MKIENSNVLMGGFHVFTESSVTTESLRAWDSSRKYDYSMQKESYHSEYEAYGARDIYSKEPQFEKYKTYSKDSAVEKFNNEGNERIRNLEKMKKEIDSLIKKAKTFFKEISSGVKPEDIENEEEDYISPKDRQKAEFIKQMIEIFTGKKIDLDLPKLKKSKTDHSFPENTADSLPEKQNWGIVYNYNTTETESESFNFKAEGNIKTADGKEISFSMEVNISREFYSSESINIRDGDALIDPLAINLSGGFSSLTDKKYEFDINMDGTNDNISFVSGGSGFLAVDKNGNGKIDDGSELFGPATGNGFQELIILDSDNNNWLDENDAEFENIKIWTKDTYDNDILRTLKETGVGAIYLDNIGAEFTFKSSTPENATLGKMSGAGIFLSEKGNVGTIQHIDLKS